MPSKHAQARRARVALACNGSVLPLSVKDAGVGFTPSSSKRMAGLGLESMRERVQVLGGTFSVQSQPDEGTEINVEVSLPKT
jgi:signal transduction histidine kinase